MQIADKMIQSDQVDVLTGIIWSNLAMAVVPAAVAQGKFYLSPNAGPSALAGANCDKNYFNVAWQNDNLHEGAGAYANSAGFKNSFILAPNYPAGTDALAGYKRFYEGELAEGSIPSSARPTTPPKSRRSARRAPTASSSSCPAAWASPS